MGVALRAGTMTGTQGKPLMELTFTAVVYRANGTTDAMGSKKLQYTLLPGNVPCDVAPMTDNNVFLQAGQREISDYVVHFYSGTNIAVNDLIKIVTSRKLSGLIGDYFEIKRMLEPSETISYIRCHATAGTAPEGP